MNEMKLAIGWTSALRGVLGIFCALLVSISAQAAEEKFDSFETEGETYQNVTVTSKTPTHVFITHSKGFANIRVETLSEDLKVQLGYKVAKVENKGQSALGLEEIPVDPEVAAARDQIIEDLKARFAGREKEALYILGGVALFFYLFYSLCCKLICEKSGFKPGLLAWVPVLQMLGLFKAARMSSLWFLLFLSPIAAPFAAKPIIDNMGPQFLPLLFIPSFLSLLATVVWAFKICLARGVAPAAGILLLLPVLNVFMFLYLAFSAPNPNMPVRLTKQDTKRWSKTQAQDTSFFMNS